MKKLSIFIILVLAIGAIFYFWQENKESKTRDPISDFEQISLSFQFSETDTKGVDFPLESPLSLAEITKKISKQKSWTYKAEDYGDMGILITQIGDSQNGEDQKYWQFFIDGEQPQISADKYFPENETFIEWRFVKSEF